MWTEWILYAAIAYLVLLVAWYLLTNADVIGGSTWWAFRAPFAAVQHKSIQRTGRAELEEELRARVQHGSRSDNQLLTAAEATTQIQVAHLWLKESTASCLETHWALAKGLAVTHMSEAAGHPRAVEMRQRNINLSQFLAEVIQTYPYPTPQLVRLEVAVPRVAATCASCPYWFSDPGNAPRVCASALALGYQHGAPPSPQPQIIDAEPMSDEE